MDISLEAQVRIDSLLQISVNANHDTVSINTNVLIGNAMINGDSESSEYYLVEVYSQTKGRQKGGLSFFT